MMLSRNYSCRCARKTGVTNITALVLWRAVSVLLLRGEQFSGVTGRLCLPGVGRRSRLAAV